MKPFSLSAVLDFRKRLEELAQNRLFEARKTVEKIEVKLLGEQNSLKETILSLETLQKEGIEIGDLIRYEAKMELLGSNIEAIKKNLADKKKIAQQEHDNLVKCSKEHQIMKRLKEKKNKAWQNYLNKKEAAMLDEIGVIRYDNDVF